MGIQPVTAGTSLQTNELQAFQTVTQEGHVTVEKSHNLLQNKDCYGVTDGIGGDGGKKEKTAKSKDSDSPDGIGVEIRI